MSHAPMAPRRRGRPPTPERRDQIIREAAHLFRSAGFANVAMKDVAATLGITASALYRHCSSKTELLHAAISSSLDVVEAALAGSEPTMAGALRSLSGAALEREDMWFLVRRELRHLSPEDRHDVQARLAKVAGELRRRLQEERPELDDETAELLARAALSALAVPSQFSFRLDFDRLGDLMAATAIRVSQLEVDPHAPAIAQRRGTPFSSDVSRREELLGAAAVLFAEQGYPGVSLNDVGATAGMTGPSVYHHFSSKVEVLVGVLRRAADWIDLDRHAAREAHLTPAEALRKLVEDHVGLALSHWELFQVYVNEAVNLPAEDHAWIRRSHRAFMDDWVALLLEARPDIDEPTARVSVFSALCIVNDLAASRRLRDRETFGALLFQVTYACLAIEPAPADGGLPSAVEG